MRSVGRGERNVSHYLVSISSFCEWPGVVNYHETTTVLYQIPGCRLFAKQILSTNTLHRHPKLITLYSFTFITNLKLDDFLHDIVNEGMSLLPRA